MHIVFTHFFKSVKKEFMTGNNNYLKAEQLMIKKIAENKECVVVYLNNATKKLTKFNKFSMRVLYASILSG